MIKGNYGRSYQQSINELFATKLHEQQEFSNHTSYFPVKVQVDGNREGLGCMCYDFCNETVECISAWEVLQTVKTKQNESYYYPLKKACLNLGMSEKVFTSFMDYQIMTDYLISNTDRHMNNIAVMRNPETLEILGFAPIYDSGNSMFYNIPYDQLDDVNMDEIKTCSFIEKESRLLRYVSDRLVLDMEKTEMDFDIYTMDVYENHIRIPKLKKLYDRKRENLHAFQQGRDIWKNNRYGI
jgi:hypothetical protein